VLIDMRNELLKIKSIYTPAVFLAVSAVLLLVVWVNTPHSYHAVLTMALLQVLVMALIVTNWKSRDNEARCRLYLRDLTRTLVKNMVELDLQRSSTRRGDAELKLETAKVRYLERNLREKTQRVDALDTTLKQVAVLDQLTGVKNRVYFDSMCQRELRRCGMSGAHLSLLLLSIDDFDEINSRYGHGFGDQCLQLIAKTIQTEMRTANDIVARYRDNVFGILLPGANTRQALAIVESIRSLVGSLDIIHDNAVVHLTLSVGVSTFDPACSSIDTTLAQDASQALAVAQYAGANQIQVALGDFINEKSISEKSGVA
jgi:diguanylate cyclase (GGDEF)-like protein